MSDTIFGKGLCDRAASNQVLTDDCGNRSHMIFVPCFLLSDVIDGGPELPHPAFVKGNRTLDGIYVSKYQNVLLDGVACSLPDCDPAVRVNFGEAREACAKKGTGWHLMTAMEWGAIALRCQKNGFLPYGNNDGGKDIREAETTARVTYRDGDKGIVRTATGTGPAEWFHDRSFDGIADLNGNVWEWVDGMRLVFGELQLGSDEAWYALNATTGMLQAADGSGSTPGSVKLDFCNGVWTWTGLPIGDFLEKPRSCAFSAVCADASVGEAAVCVLHALGVLPTDRNFDYGSVSFYANNAKSERMAFRGGRYGQGLEAGIFKTCLDDPRSASGEMIGFRAVYTFE